MGLFRRRIFEISAWQVRDRDVPPEWALHFELDSEGAYLLPTPDGVQRATNGDYLIRDGSGVVYSMPRYMFERLYEPVAHRSRLLAAAE